MGFQLYNTHDRSVVNFVPREDGKVGLYCCGPTVYNYAHLGNLRTYIQEDVLRRALEWYGYEVSHVMNITDVGHLTDDADDGEDKMEKRSRETGKSVWEIAEFYTEAFFEDCRKLNVIRPHETPRATKHIDEMIGLVQRLEDKGYTYTAGGNVYFDTEKFPEYGKMALLDKQDQKAGARIAVDAQKKNPRDFVLWFTKSKFENQTMQWDSPWGRGYPGWHLECSAMSMKYLGEQFDIHCGGIDHVPVHHTNEIAQSEAATGKRWVNHWVHYEFLLSTTGKVSKSGNNFSTLATLEDGGFEPLDYRFFVVGGHYRSQVNFTHESMDAAKRARAKLVDRIRSLRSETPASNLADIGEKAREYLSNFEQHLFDDVMLPRCLSELWGILKDPSVPAGDKLAVAFEMDRIFALDLSEIGPAKDEQDDRIDALLKEREEARDSRDFARADEIRDQLKAEGITVIDTPAGSRWQRDL